MSHISEELQLGETIGADAVLRFYNDSARRAASDFYWEKLQGSVRSGIDLDMLRICIRLLPPFEPIDSITPLYERLLTFTVDRIPKEPDDENHLYSLASICLSNTQLGFKIFKTTSEYLIGSSTSAAFQDELQQMEYEGLGSSMGDQLCRVLAYLKFLKCSYWLPSDQNHYITPELLNTVVRFVGVYHLDAAAHNTLSALLSLLANPPVIIFSEHSPSQAFLDGDIGASRSVLRRSVVGQSLFDRLAELSPEYFSSKASKAFRTWFQWVSHANANEVEIEALYDSNYWTILRLGLIKGFGDQRKYCIGILCQSLAIAKRSFATPQMTFDIGRKTEYKTQYDRFSTLFETIVLDRSSNQVQACLPELTRLLGPASLISPSWTTALLSTVLHPTVQDGIRKIVGNWYMDYVVEEQNSIVDHTDFLVDGFLPWATQGSLFTSSLVSSRATTTCLHGTALANVIARFIVAVPTDLDRRKVSRGVLTFILNTGGKIFAPSVLYLLEGLLDGLNAGTTQLEASELDALLKVSRLPGQPEIAQDLCSTYCAQLSGHCDHRLPHSASGYDVLATQFDALQTFQPSGSKIPAEDPSMSQSDARNGIGLKGFIKQLQLSKHNSIKDESFSSGCNEVMAILNQSDLDSIPYSELFEIMDALWEEADRQDYPRQVVVNIPPLFFHPACMHVCVQNHSRGLDKGDKLTSLLAKVLVQLQRLTEGRSNFLAVVATSFRKACFSTPRVVSILPLEDFFVRFINNPPSPKKEFLFEIAAAEQLQKHVPRRDFALYHGRREWHGYAAIIDLLNRFPDDQLVVMRRLFSRLTEPWKAQAAPVPVISKWKDVLQLQTMLLLTESCITESDATWYLDAFVHALVLEQWPRYRFLLEWIIARIYYRFPGHTDRILTDLAKLDDSSPVHIASLIKIAVLVAPFLDSADFALRLMVRLIAFSASPKVQVRHEAHWSFPILFDLAFERKWNSITGNLAFQALNDHVHGLDRFNAPPLTIRTLPLDAVKDYTIANIFQGLYLRIETPELERVAYEDFVTLFADDNAWTPEVKVPPARIPLGDPTPDTTFESNVVNPRNQVVRTAGNADATPVLFQTKSGFDMASLLPAPGLPSVQDKQPASVILVASLIDNPFNLGGLSRISESFGLEALYIDDLKKTLHKDFKATSVTSEKHLPIRELKIPAVPEFLVSLKRQGYEVVGIEQTDQSGMLGEESGDKGIGTLQQKCVLVLGSERGGITSEVLASVDRCVEIRTVGVTRSLNVQTAGGIAVYEWWREWGGKV